MSDEKIIIEPPEDEPQEAEAVPSTDLTTVLNGIDAILDMQIECCGNCKFFQDSTSVALKGKQGFCRRYPPTVAVVGVQPSGIVGRPPTTITQSNWPPVTPSLSCGEFKNRLVQ